MTMEVNKLLSWAVLDTSSLASGSSTPKRPGSLALATPLPLKPEDSTKPVDTSSQVSVPDDTEMDDPTLEEIHASPSPPVKTLGPSGNAPSLDVTQLQEEANKALGHLLVTRSLLMLIRGNRFQILGWPFAKMSLRPLRPSRKQRPSAPAPSEMPRPTGQC